MARIRSLILKNFRNHEIVTLHFGDGINLIVGRNAQGKTNILESIYMLGRGKSFRAGDHRDVIKWGYEDCFIEAEICKDLGSDKLAAFLSGTEKAFKINGKRGSKGIQVVLFVPQDIMLFRDTPGVRRTYLDDFISNLDNGYKTNLREYTKILSQRNRILKDWNEPGRAKLDDQLVVWTERLVAEGVKLMIKRFYWFNELNSLLPSIYSYMGGVGGEPKLISFSNVEATDFSDSEEIKKAFLKRLGEREQLEKIRGVSLVGPHRDDWSATVSGNDLKMYGSQSQMRMMALSLKVAELKLMKELFGESPVLLLDDVISELDEISSVKLVEYVRGIDGQVFITTTSEGRLVEDLGDGIKIYEIMDEKVLSKSS